MKATALRFGLFLLLFGLFFPTSGLTDGMVIPQRTYAVPKIPDQQALIHYAEGVETLVIETSFEGLGTNFAWIVPVPAEPNIRAVSPGVFPTLQTIFQPRVVRFVQPWWLLLPAGMFLVWLASLIRRGKGAIAVLLLGLAVVTLCVVLPGLGHAVSRGSMAGTADTLHPAVSVLNRDVVGLFDVTTLKASDTAALLSWLNQNGYGMPTNIAPVVADYIKEGWVFAAARLNREPGSAAKATHPLAFTFKTERAVYPLRLTAKGTEACRVDLYVFAAARAAADGFKLDRCEAPQFVANQSRPSLVPGPLRIRHAGLTNLVGGAAVATKLSGVLSSTDMQRDLYLKWKHYRAAGQKVYTSRAAWTLGWNVAALSFMGLVCVWWSALGTKTGVRLKIQGRGYWCVPAGLVLGLIVFLLLPRMDAGSFRTMKASFAGVHNDCWMLASELEDVLPASTALTNSLHGEMPSPGELNRWLDGIGHVSGDRRQPVTNFFTRQRIRFEASPGNLVLRPARAQNAYLQRQPEFELIWHDFDGAEALSIPVYRHYFK